MVSREDFTQKDLGQYLFLMYGAPDPLSDEWGPVSGILKEIAPDGIRIGPEVSYAVTRAAFDTFMLGRAETKDSWFIPYDRIREVRR